MDVRGKGVIVTGASRGLGAALAGELARRGARVAMVARTEADLTRVARAIRAEGGEAHAIVADLGDKEAIHRVAGAAAALVGDVEVLIQNAGTLGPAPLPLLLDARCEDLEHALAVNVLGPFRLGKALIGPMVLRGRGVVLHVSSDAAVAAYPGWGVYGASKAAFDQLSRVWAAELDGTGVRFVALDPGEMDTAMHAAAVPDADRTALARPAAVARIAADVVAAELPPGERVLAQAWGAR